MKSIISRIKNMFNKNQASELDTLMGEMEEGDFKDYLKANIINENILPEILKTDQIRIKLISSLIQKLTTETEDLSISEQSKENIRSVKWLKESLSKNENRLEKLINRRQTVNEEKDRETNELKFKISELRKFINEDAIDLYFNEIKKNDSIKDLETEKVLLESRYNKVERDYRSKIISSLNYTNEKTEIFLELLNLIDEIYERNHTLSRLS